MSHRLYARLGSAAKRALEHHPGNDENGEEYGESHFGEFGEYMRRKKLKLQNQDEEIRRNKGDSPQIFKGMVIHINGYTKPPREDLHHLIVKHGGVYKQYLEGKTFVTHIIASNLTPKKRVEFERYKVVRPEWILDCVKTGKALPWNNYRLIVQNAQQTLGFTQNPVEGYKAVSSRDEKVIFGGGGMQPDSSQKSSSSIYPTPPEMKMVDLDAIEQEADRNSESIQATLLEGQTHSDECKMSANDPTLNVLSEQTDHKHHESINAPNVFPEQYQAPAIPSEDNEQQNSPVQVVTIPDNPPGVGSNKNSLGPPNPEVTEDPAMLSAAHNAAILANPSLRSSTVINPDFLKSYFDQSRLHHLSIWKADLKNQMQQLASQKPGRLNHSGPRWIMHVDFDCFFCSVSLVSRPELKDKPVCVGHGGARSGEISSCNYPARRFGIRNGMSMQRGLELCPNLICLPYDFPAYEQASRDFYEILLSVNADATQAVSVDEALLDVSSVGGADPEAIAKSIRDRVREKTQCDVSVGIGGNILLAKLALRKAKPAGQHLLKAEEAEEYMENIDVQDLPGVGWKLSEKLEEVMNIRTVGEVRKRSLSELKEKLGPKTGEKLYDFARGIDHTKVGEIVQRKSVSVEVSWGVRFETGEQVDAFLLSLATELSTRMIKESVIGTHLMLKVMRRAGHAPFNPPKHLGHGECDTFNRSTQLGVGSNSPEILGKETILMMRSLRIPPAELRGIGLQMGKLERIDGVKSEGQKKLNFSKAPKSDILEFTEVNDQSPVVRPRTPVEATQFIAPTQIDQEVLANLPQDIRARLVSRKADQPIEIQSNQIDEKVLSELPPNIQQELLQTYKRPSTKIIPTKKKVSPRKPRTTSMVGQSKLLLVPQDDLDTSVLAALPTSIRQEVISEACRERALEHASKVRHMAWAAERAVRDRKINRTISIPEPPPKPTFQKLSELPDLRNLISMWFEELRDEGPAEEDVELLRGYLQKVVLIEKDIRKAESVVRWFLWCCRQTGLAMDEWVDAGMRLGDSVNDACNKRGIGKIDFDSQAL